MSCRHGRPQEKHHDHEPLIRVALIGAGRIGSNHAALIARDIPNAELIAIADPVEGAAAKLAESLGVEQSYTDIAELLARPDLDAVVITAPPRFHTALVEQAAAAGKAIFCEKPTGVSLEELRRVEAAVERHDVVFQVGFNRRYANGFPSCAPPSMREPSARRSCSVR